MLDWLRKTLGMPMQSAAEPLNTGVPSVATTAGSKKLFKTASEKGGYTMAGGKRLTRRRKSSKKTHKRKH
jgi:hypothetical protein